MSACASFLHGMPVLGGHSPDSPPRRRESATTIDPAYCALGTTLLTREKLRVLILTLDTGGGHRAPALAVEEALDRLYPDRFDIEVTDLALASGAMRAYRHITGAWDFALAHPWAPRLGYTLVETLRPLVKYYLPVMLPDLIEAGTRLMGRHRPDLVLSTHYLSTDVAHRARGSLGLRYPLVQLVTEPWDAFFWWAVAGADLHCVSSEQARDMLIARGVSASAVRTVAFPVARRFLDPGRRPEEVRRELGLDSNRPTILFTLGARGIGATSSLAEALCQRGPPCNLVCVTGKNVRERERLARIAESTSKTVLVPLGMVGNMHDLLAVSDLVVGKGGASTTMEALAMGKPILFTACAAQNERPTIDYCLKHGAGWFPETRADLFDLLDRLLSSDELAAAAQRIRSLGLELGADELAHLLADCVPAPTGARASRRHPRPESPE